MLDPFAGSASTLIAARELGLSFVGIEVDPQHHKAASGRLRQKRGQILTPGEGSVWMALDFNGRAPVVL